MKKIKKSKMAKIFGGQEISTKSETVIEGQCGSTQTTTMNDTFNDKNGDGIWGAGEGGTKSVTVVYN